MDELCSGMARIQPGAIATCLFYRHSRETAASSLAGKPIGLSAVTDRFFGQWIPEMVENNHNSEIRKEPCII